MKRPTTHETGGPNKRSRQTFSFERIAWLNIHGVPLHLSGNETFDSIGRCFGKVIHASQRQPEDNFLTYDSVCVLTDTVNRIEEVVSIVEEGKRFKVWVEEERRDWVPDSIENQEESLDEDVINISAKKVDVEDSRPMSGSSGTDDKEVPEKFAYDLNNDFAGTTEMEMDNDKRIEGSFNIPTVAGSGNIPSMADSRVNIPAMAANVIIPTMANSGDKLNRKT
ncbi:hypothetical protein Hanom_Chr10g00952771 [Helianthus anomalus]